MQMVCVPTVFARRRGRYVRLLPDIIVYCLSGINLPRSPHSYRRPPLLPPHNIHPRPPPPPADILSLLNETSSFLRPHNTQEHNRARQLCCSICGERGASIGCSVSSCSVSVHFPCAIKASHLERKCNIICMHIHKHARLRFSFSLVLPHGVRQRVCVCVCVCIFFLYFLFLGFLVQASFSIPPLAPPPRTRSASRSRLLYHTAELICARTHNALQNNMSRVSSL